MEAEFKPTKTVRKSYCHYDMIITLVLKSFKGYGEHEKTNRENIDRDHCLYLFHYRLMQKMMIKMSYPAFKYYTRSVSRQLLEHHKEFMNSLDEWTSTSDDGQDDFGRRIEANKNKTLH